MSCISDTLRIVDIIEGTTVDGPGLRTSIYLAGCDHRCPGCHNPSTWDFQAGRDITIDDLCAVIAEADFNVTLSGGDPMYQPTAVAALCQRIKQMGYTVWCYTGFTWHEVLNDPARAATLQWIDVLVDGPFIADERDISLRFRGSRNQRLIRVAESLALGKIVEWG